MGKTSAIFLAIFIFLFSSCTRMVQRTIDVEKSNKDDQAVITINTTLRSYFDPDGFSREYNPKIAINVFGNGKNMTYRNAPGTTFHFGKDFDVSIDYCSGGYIWVSEDESKLGVALFDIKAPFSFNPLENFNGSYSLTRKQADLLLRKY